MRQLSLMRNKTSLTPITSSTTFSNPQHKAPLPPQRKNMIITRGSTTTRRLVTKIGLLYPSPVSDHRDSYIHQALHIGTKFLCHLLKPLFTYPNLLSLLQQITHSCIICSSVSPQGALKPVPSWPTRGSRTYPRRRLANWLHPHASKMKNKTQAHSSRHFFRVDWGFSYEIRNCLGGDSFSYKKSSLALASHSLSNLIMSQLLSPKSFNKQTNPLT